MGESFELIMTGLSSLCYNQDQFITSSFIIPIIIYLSSFRFPPKHLMEFLTVTTGGWQRQPTGCAVLEGKVGQSANRKNSINKTKPNKGRTDGTRPAVIQRWRMLGGNKICMLLTND